MSKSKRKAPPNCFWRGDTLWGDVQVAGKRIRQSLRTGDAKLAVKRIAEFTEQEIGRAHFGGDTTRKTYKDMVTRWAVWIKQAVAGKRTHERYATSLGKLEPFLKDLYFDEITYEFLGTVKDARLLEGVTMATVRRDFTALSSVFSYATEEAGWTGPNPAKARLQSSAMKEFREPIVLPREQDIKEVIKRANNVFSDLVLALWRTGCRIEELQTAKRDDLDEAHKQIVVTGKGRKQRIIELVGLPTPDCFELFKTRPVKIGTRLLFWWDGAQRQTQRAKDVDPDTILTPSRKFGDLINRIKKEVEAEGKTFRRFTLHHLRHRHAVDYLKAGGNIYDLQHRMGHSSITVTEGYLKPKFLTAAEIAQAKTSLSSHAPLKYAAVS